MEELQDLMKLITRQGEVWYMHDTVLNALKIMEVATLYRLSSDKILTAKKENLLVSIISEETAKELVERYRKDVYQWVDNPVTGVFTNINTKNKEYAEATITHNRATEQYELEYECELGVVKRKLYVATLQAAFVKANDFLRTDRVIE